MPLGIGAVAACRAGGRVDGNGRWEAFPLDPGRTSSSGLLTLIAGASTLIEGTAGARPDGCVGSSGRTIDGTEGSSGRLIAGIGGAPVSWMLICGAGALEDEGCAGIYGKVADLAGFGRSGDSAFGGDEACCSSMITSLGFQSFWKLTMGLPGLSLTTVGRGRLVL